MSTLNSIHFNIFKVDIRNRFMKNAHINGIILIRHT